MSLLTAVGLVLNPAPVAGPFEGPVAAEVGMLLAIGAIGCLAGYAVRWFWRCVRTVTFVAMILAVALSLAGVSIRLTDMPSITPEGLARPLTDAARGLAGGKGLAGLRAGVGAAGFALGVLASGTASRRRRGDG